LSSLLLVNNDLIFRLKKNEDKAFAELIDVFGVKVFNLCISFTKNIEDAEDLTQDIFTKIFQSIHNFKGDASLATWIYKISVNQCYEYLRRNKRLKRTGQKVEISFAEQKISGDVSTDPEKVLINSEYRIILFNALENLGEKQRMAFSLQHFQGYSYQEIAVLMDVSHSAVESLIYRARQNLMKELETIYQNYIN
jgi:RNA polymerase sigma factor (sigma-70 family)